MEFVMTIGDVVIIPNGECVIVGGNSEITKYDTSRLCKKGEHIVIKSANEDFEFKVLEIHVSFSMSESVIISIQLEASEKLNYIKQGDFVYRRYEN